MAYKYQWKKLGFLYFRIPSFYGLEENDGPFNIEMFTGDPADNNCNFFFGGAMDVLQPYIDSGKLVECGTHEELTAAGGRYAYMFRLQAEKYRE